MPDLTLGELFIVASAVPLLNPRPGGAIYRRSFGRTGARGVVHWQILILGLTFMGLGIMSDGMVALLAGAAGNFLRRNRRFLRLQRWLAGTSFIALGSPQRWRRGDSPHPL